MDLPTLTEAGVAKFVALGSSGLSPTERLLVAIWGLEADVNNGGFDQYYFNSYGEFASEVPRLLRAIGANQTALLVEQANAAFGSKGPPADCDERQEVVENLASTARDQWSDLDARFWTYPDDISALLQTYLNQSA